MKETCKMILKVHDATINKIIGVESDSSTGETYHHITIIISAKRINPKDFKGIPSKGDVKIEIVSLKKIAEAF